MKRALTVLTLLLLSLGALAQSQFAKPADANSLPGVYQLIEFPDANQPKFLKQNPWPATCQFFGIYKNGYLLHQETHLGACSNQIPKAIPVAAQDVEWKFVQAGILSIARKDGKGVTQYWKVDKVTANTHLDKTNLSSGDLVMQLIGPEKKAVWVRLLKKVGDA